MAGPRIMRSFLIAPGNRADLVAKFPRFRADFSIIDLEDGTPAAEKPSARDRLPQPPVRLTCPPARLAPAGETPRGDAPARAPRERQQLASFPYFNEYRTMGRRSRLISAKLEMIIPLLGAAL